MYWTTVLVYSCCSWIINDTVMVVPLCWCLLINSVGLQLLQLDNGDIVTVVPLCWCVNSVGLHLLQWARDNRGYCNGCSVRLMCQQC